MSKKHVDVLLYASYLHVIGGIETFVMNYLELMGSVYSLGVMVRRLDDVMEARIRDKVPLFTDQDFVSCDTLLMVRMMDEIPKNIMYKKTIRMCHCCQMNPTWKINPNYDTLVHVSEASKKSFDTDGQVILNPLFKDSRKALMLVSATRVPAADKGENLDRILKLARKLNENNILFIWLYFSDNPIPNAPKGLVHVGTYQDIQPYIARADYLVLLSQQEGFGYCVLEALVNNTAVICTPFDTTKELGVIDGENGYIIPYDLDFDVNKLLNVPKFKYSWNNNKLRNKWRSLIGVPDPDFEDGSVVVVVINDYNDLKLGKQLHRGYMTIMDNDRALELANKRLVRIIE